MASSIGNDKLIGLSARFKQERLRLGLTQAQAADVCGVSRQMIGLYEGAKGEPGACALAAMAEAGADVLYILTGNQQGMSYSENDLSEGEAKLLENYRRGADLAKTALLLMSAHIEK